MAKDERKERWGKGAWRVPRTRQEMKPNEIAAAYAIDRAEQYEQSSGIYSALVDVAAALANGEHVIAYEHGELDDLARRVRLMVRK